MIIERRTQQLAIEDLSRTILPACSWLYKQHFLRSHLNKAAYNDRRAYSPFEICVNGLLVPKLDAFKSDGRKLVSPLLEAQVR